jgi:hypothetical protein
MEFEYLAAILLVDGGQLIQRRYARFLWRIDALCTESRIAMAGKNYPRTLHENSQLRLMLEHWLGKEWVEQQQKAGKIDFDSPRERKAAW